MASLNIKDPEVHRMVKSLAEEHQTSMTEEVRQAVRERFEQLKNRPNPKAGLADWIIEYSNTTAPHFVGDDRTRDLFEDLYDENGLPK
jgi:antitoxin VapB